MKDTLIKKLTRFMVMVAVLEGLRYWIISWKPFEFGLYCVDLFLVPTFKCQMMLSVLIGMRSVVYGLLIYTILLLLIDVYKEGNEDYSKAKHALKYRSKNVYACKCGYETGKRDDFQIHLLESLNEGGK